MSQTGPRFNGSGCKLKLSGQNDGDHWAGVTLPPGIRSGPVLIAGPTASGKSALALHIARTFGGLIINADALQVFAGWPVLTAQPGPADLARAPHALYGHIPYDATYSVGHWLRDAAPLLQGPDRPIIVGGSGLYFTALTTGLAVIPTVPSRIRRSADAMTLAQLVSGLDQATIAKIDTHNRARVQRAAEVFMATSRTLTDWQADTPAPLLPLGDCTALALYPPVDWLNARIIARFDIMLDQGALAEAAGMRPHWNPAHLSAKAIGAAALIAHLDGQLSLAKAREAAIIASRQYAKRQRTWLRARMSSWTAIDPALRP